MKKTIAESLTNITDHAYFPYFHERAELLEEIRDVVEEAYDLGLVASLPGGAEMTIARLLEREGL